MEAIYYSEPNAINYMPLPDGRTDVWLRKNIEAGKDEEGNTCWTCDEISFRTSLSIEEIEENFDTIWENGGPEEEMKATESSDISSELVDELIKLYILMISSGIITIDDVPAKWETAVKAEL